MDAVAGENNNSDGSGATDDTDGRRQEEEAAGSSERGRSEDEGSHPPQFFPPGDHSLPHVGLYETELSQNWHFIHRANLLKLMHELLSTGDFRSLASVVATAMQSFSAEDDILDRMAIKRRSEHRTTVLHTALSAGLEVMQQAHRGRGRNVQVLKYLSALRGVKSLRVADRELFGMEVAFCHLENGDLPTAYQTIDQLGTRFTGALAKHETTKELRFHRSVQCGLIRHLQFMQYIQERAEETGVPEASGGSEELFDAAEWAPRPTAWKRCSVEAKDYWEGACKHLREALKRKPWATLSAYLLVQLNILAGRVHDAYAVAALHAEAAPHQADAAALHCLMLRLRASSSVDRMTPLGQDDAVKVEASSEVEGQSDAPPEGALVEAHLRLMRLSPASEQAMDGVWSQRAAMKPAQVVEALLLHLDCLGGPHMVAESVAHAADLAWGRLRECLWDVATTISLDNASTEQRAEANRIAALLAQRQGWWERYHFLRPPTPSALAAQGPLRDAITAKAYCSVFVLYKTSKKWLQLTKRALLAAEQDGSWAAEELGQAEVHARQLFRIAGWKRDRTPPTVEVAKKRRSVHILRPVEAEREGRALGGGGGGSVVNQAAERQGLPEEWWRVFPQRRARAITGDNLAAE